MTRTGSTSVSHDARGNVTAIGSASYGYSSESMLTSGPGGASLAYDPLNRLYQTAGAATTRFAYDGTTIIAEYNGSNALLRRYVHAPGALAEPLVWYEGSGTSDRRWLHADERGSIIAVSNSAGAVTNVNGYDEYGRPASGNAGRFQYTGQPWLPEIGMYYYRARVYNPALGRFMQADPIGYEAGMNLYRAMSGDPVNLTDPSGLCTGTRLKCNGAGLATGVSMGNSLSFSGGGGGGLSGAIYIGGSPGSVSTDANGTISITAGTPGRSFSLPTLASIGSWSIRDLIDHLLYGDEITVTGRPLRVEDLGVTEGGTVTVIGRISRDHNNLLIWIDELEATEVHPGSSIVLQGLEAARGRARSMGLPTVRISGIHANEGLQRFMDRYSRIMGLPVRSWSYENPNSYITNWDIPAFNPQRQ